MSEELGRRAVACARWRWMAGMMATYPMDLPSMPGERWGERLRVNGLYDVRNDDPLPDLDDPATVGCLLALVREAYDDELAHVRPCAGGWDFHTLDPMAPRVTAPSEAQCLVAALEGAP